MKPAVQTITLHPLHLLHLLHFTDALWQSLTLIHATPTTPATLATLFKPDEVIGKILARGKLDYI
ncbi:MAG: hypothetical protein ACJ788_06500 [Ktedonobacteraceae bacterium]